MRSEPIVPDFTPVKAEEVRAHLDACPDCRGRMERWCPEGKRLFNKLADQGRRERERADEKQAWDLMHAGWKFELPASLDPPIMSWYWRSPPKRKGSRGRFYASTNQAWNALQRYKPCES